MQKITFREVKKDGVVSKRPDVSYSVELPTVELLATVLGEDNAKFVAALLQDHAADYVRGNVKELPDVTEFGEFTIEQLAAAYFAKGEGRGKRAIAEEIWQLFLSDYLTIMPTILGKSVDIITQHVAVLEKRCSDLKGQKVPLNNFKGYLAAYVDNSNELDTVEPVVELLTGRLHTMLEALESKENLLNLL